MPQNRGAVLLAANGDFEIRDWDVPATSGEEVLIEIELCGICGTDVHVYRGEVAGVPYPVLLGHENVGRIAEVPTGYRDVFGRELRRGDRVVVAGAYFGECGRCLYCDELGAPWACAYRVSYPVEIAGELVPTFGGGFARYLRLTPPESRMLIRIEASAEAAALYEPLSVATQMLLGGPHILGTDVAVQGTGAIGLLMVLVAKAAGASRVIAVGGPSGRLALAKRLGANVVIDIDEVRDAGERAGIVRAETAGGVGVAVGYECAGVPSAVTEGLSYLRQSGVLMEAGNAADTGTVALSPYHDIQRQRRQVIGVRGRTLRDFTAAARFAERHQEEVTTLLTHTVGLDRARDAVTALTGRYQFDDEDVVKIAVRPQD